MFAGKEMEQLIDSIESLRQGVQACRQLSALNTVQKAMLSCCVVGMRLELKHISKHITDACNGNYNNCNQPPSCFLSAIKSKEELDVMECSLSNKDHMRCMIEWINRTQKLRKKENRLNGLFYMLLDRSFLLNCSWLGQKYKGVSKIHFGKYTNLISLLHNSSGMNGTEVEKFIKC
uniref:DUF4806 domain-containing protein n=1 Tax=Anopheles atroparvus TaxID=41427 RepID=A0AAG5DPZ9_ANOAO